MKVKDLRDILNKCPDEQDVFVEDWNDQSGGDAPLDTVFVGVRGEVVLSFRGPDAVINVADSPKED